MGMWSFYYALVYFALFQGCLISAAGFPWRRRRHMLKNAQVHVWVCAYTGVQLLATHKQLAKLYISQLPSGLNACANTVVLSSCALGNTHGIGSPIMQRVPKPGSFTKVSTTRDTSTLSGPSLLYKLGIWSIEIKHIPTTQCVLSFFLIHEHQTYWWNIAPLSEVWFMVLNMWWSFDWH